MARWAACDYQRAPAGAGFPRRLPLVALSLLLALALAPAGLLRPAPAAAGHRQCFPETGFCAENAFYAFWRSHGALPILGLPVGQPIYDNDGMLVQYYERAIMEWHPGNPPAYQVELTQLGAGLLGDRPERSAAPVPCAGDCLFFDATNHTLRAGFLSYWRGNGGLPVFGYPLSEEFDEYDPAVDAWRTVQYFERSRFEWWSETGQLTLGLLGAESWQAQSWLHDRPAASVPDYSAPLPGAPVELAIPALGVSAPVEAVGYDADGNMAAPARPFDVSWFEPGTRPGAAGNAVMAGHVDYHGIGPVIFWRLHELWPGAEVWVTDSNGARWRFVVERIESYRLADSPREAIFGPTDETRLNLITCSGDFDPASRSYDRRLVVYTRWDGVPRS